MGRPRKIKSVAEMERLWNEYKNACDNQLVLTHEFSAKNSEFVSKNLQRKVSKTIKGFCLYVGLSRSKFYGTYEEDERFQDIIERICDECEEDARTMFETGQIPAQLAGLWMSKYGYGTNVNAKIDAEELVNEWVRGVIANDSE